MVLVASTETKGPDARNLCFQDRPVVAKNKNELVEDDSVTSHVDEMLSICAATKK